MGQGVPSGLLDRDRARLTELRLADGENCGVQLHVVQFERQRFTRAQTGGSEKSDEGCQAYGSHYIGRANTLEDNVVLYKVEQGKRKSLEIVGARVASASKRKSPRALTCVWFGAPANLPARAVAPGAEDGARGRGEPHPEGRKSGVGGEVQRTLTAVVIGGITPQHPAGAAGVARVAAVVQTCEGTGAAEPMKV
jgi:hypothetical protein